MYQSDVTIKFSVKWNWAICGFMGDDIVFNTMQIEMENTFHTTYTYKGFGWQSFYKVWKQKAETFLSDCKKHEPSNDIKDWLAWLDISKNKDAFETKLLVLNFQSKDVLLEIVKNYEEQYNLIVEDCSSYDQFLDIMTFLKEVPLYIIEAMEELCKQQVNIEQNNISIHPFPRDKIIYSNNEKEFDYRQEKKYSMTKEDVVAYKSFIESVELQNIVLDNLNVKRFNAPKGKELSVNLEPTFKITKRKKDSFIASAKFDIVVHDDLENKVFSLNAKFLLYYTFSPEIELTEPMEERFLKTSVPVNSWPYGRELISSTTTRMGYPALVIGTFKVL